MGVAAAVRDGDWKLIRIRGHDPLLFNLAGDLAEAHDLAVTEPARVKDLLKKIEAWEKPFPPPRWTNGEYWDKVGIKYHTGPPRYHGPVNSAITNQE